MIKQMFDKTAPQTVHGWERAASLAGGLVMMGKGLRRGGLIGIAELAMGGMALARGISGRCEAKRMLAEMESKPALPSQRYSRIGELLPHRWTPAGAGRCRRGRTRSNSPT